MSQNSYALKGLDFGRENLSSFSVSWRLPDCFLCSLLLVVVKVLVVAVQGRPWTVRRVFTGAPVPSSSVVFTHRFYIT